MNPILKKLGLVEQDPVLILNAPQSFKPVEGEIEGKVHIAPLAIYNFVMVFATEMDEAEKLAKLAMAAFKPNGHFWLCYPKGTSKTIRSNINRNKAWAIMAPYDLEPVSQVALDEDWTAMRFKPVDQIKKMERKTAATRKGRERIEKM